MVLPDSTLDRAIAAIRRLDLQVYSHTRVQSNVNHVLWESCSATMLTKVYPALIDRIVREGGAYCVQRTCSSEDDVPSHVAELVDSLAETATLRLHTYPKHNQAAMLTLLGQHEDLRSRLTPSGTSHQLAILQTSPTAYLIGIMPMQHAICAVNPTYSLETLHDYRSLRQQAPAEGQPSSSPSPSPPETIICRAQLKLAELFEGGPSDLKLPTGCSEDGI